MSTAFQGDTFQIDAFQIGAVGGGAPPAGTIYGGGLDHIQCGFVGANATGIPQTLHTIEQGISA